MNLTLTTGRLQDLVAETLIVLGFENDPPDALSELTSGWTKEIYSSGEFKAKNFETVTLYRPAGMKAKRLVLVGAGDAKKFTPYEFRRVIGAGVRAVKAKSLRDIIIALQPPFDSPEFLQVAVEGVILGDYEPDQLKTDPAKTEKRIASSTFVVAARTPEAERAFERGRIIADAQNFARDLKNEPSNRLTPPALVERAREMAREADLEIEILDEPRMRQLGMGALLGVAQGSSEPPALIILRYTPESPVNGDHLALVGKGVTFDSGGISIKPADGMEKMKYDMGGGAAVLGAMKALARLRPPVKVTAFVPTVENMISGRAQRPGDIVTSLSGKTVEVLNTDAEGRLILIDAMTYAIRQGCTHLIDAATLTGAIVVALGHVHMGAFTNNQELLDRVLAASRSAGERMWQMPLDDDYKEYLKTAFADLPNIGGRWGGAITAAYFLKEFTEDKPWVHLDIAGTAWLDEAKPFMAKGPSGVPLRTFVDLAMNWGK
jgi:leucyl aminopeptidase